jgi:hypothetical protein
MQLNKAQRRIAPSGVLRSSPGVAHAQADKWTPLSAECLCDQYILLEMAQNREMARKKMTKRANACQ